jgi:hypothetical protein
MDMKARIGVLFMLSLALGGVGYKFTQENYVEKENISQKNGFTFATPGDDTAVFVVDQHRKGAPTEYYEAGAGRDTLWLKTPKGALQDPLFTSDIVRFYYYLMTASDAHSPEGTGTIFEFHKYPLKIRNFESLVIEEDKTPGQVPAKHTLPANSFQIRDTFRATGA